MASVRKRACKNGQIAWQVDFRDGTGTRRSRQFRSKADAILFETKVRAELAKGMHSTSTKTVADAGALWLLRGDRENLELGTLRQYRQHLQIHIKPLIGNIPLSDITPVVVERFRDAILAKSSRALSRAILTSLKGVFKEAVRLGLLASNPAQHASVKISKREKRRVQIPTREQIRKILQTAAEMWPHTASQTTRSGEKKTVAIPWHPFLVTAIFTGLRASELRGLGWHNVDLQRGVIRVRERADFQNSMGAPKSEAGNRDIPMTPLVWHTLRIWRLVCPDTKLQLVFPTENGTIYANSNIHRQCWQPLLTQIGLRSEDQNAPRPARGASLTFHSLRHAAASMFIEQGWLPKKVQTIMGHSSIQVTFDTYGHLWTSTEDDLIAMAEIEKRILA